MFFDFTPLLTIGIFLSKFGNKDYYYYYYHYYCYYLITLFSILSRKLMLKQIDFVMLINVEKEHSIAMDYSVFTVHRW